MKPEIIVLDTPEQVALRGVSLFARSVDGVLRQRDFFTLALSGGSTPRPMHRMFALKPYRDHVPWERIHLLWVDERCVPVEDPASNYGAARRDFLDQGLLPSDQVHPMPCYPDPQGGAAAYEAEILRIFGLPQGGLPRLDLVFLGIGKDGHTASLFPGDKALQERDGLVAAVQGGDPDVPRMTLTLPILNRAREIVFTVTGKDKGAVVRKILAGRFEALPAQCIAPEEGRVTWLLDQGAASML